MQETPGIGGPARKTRCPKASLGRGSRGQSTLLSKETSSSDSATMTVREAGRKGGLACRRNHGRGFYVEIGKRGQQVMRARYPDKAREWGRLGGRPRKLALDEIMGQESE